MKKKFLSILLATLMVVSLLPTVALATETAGLDNFKKVQTYTDGQFTDVKAKDWFAENVEASYELNLMVGKSGKFFDTESNLTVAEAMTIAARLREIYYTGKAEFKQGQPWYKVYTDYCKENKIADPADYDLNKAITRGQFAEIFSKAFPKEALKKINNVQDNMIPDVSKTDKFSAAIYLLYRAGILTGNDSKGTFASDTNIRRIEAAAITTRMAQPALRKSITLVKQSSGGGSYIPPAPAKYSVTFNMNGHGTQIDPITNVTSGSKIIAPTAPTEVGYTFGGWYQEAACENEWNFATNEVTKSITLYAKWTQTIYTITLDANGGTGGSATTTVTYGASATASFTAPTKTGHTLDGWYSAKDGGYKVLSADGQTMYGAESYTAPNDPVTWDRVVTTENPVTLYAHWTANSYTITYKDQGDEAFSGIHGENHPTSHTYGTATTLVAPTKTGYTFEGWFTTSDCTGTAVTELGATAYDADITLYAKWAKTVADILATVDGGFPVGEFDEDSLWLDTPSNAWSNGAFVMFVTHANDLWSSYDAISVIRGASDSIPAPCLSDKLTQNENSWVITNDFDITYSFNMENDKLVSVTVSGSTMYGSNENGTYAAPTAPKFATVEEILATVESFPSTTSYTAPDNAWRNEEGCKLYIYDSGFGKELVANNERIALTKSVTSAGANWTCATDYTGVTFTFIMTDGVLESVTVSGSSGDGNGTYYAEVMTLQNIIDTYRNDFPTTADAGWKCDDTENLMYYDYSSTWGNSLKIGSENVLPIVIMQHSHYAHKVNGGYEYTLYDWCLIHFNIQGDNLVSVEVKAILDAYNKYAGTYTAPATSLPTGALSAVFSVSATKKVHFSQGNLYWDGSAFKFEANQYSGTSYANNHVSHFYWSKDASVAYAEEYNDGSASGSDVFFTNATAETAKSDFTVNGVTGKYRTLSTAEWTYLFNNHTMKLATVNGVNGYVIAPDGFKGTLADSYADDAALAANNLVFLPAAGSRIDSDVYGVGDSGLYWSSTAVDEYSAYGVVFDSAGVGPGYDVGRYTGCSVRLVTEVPEVVTKVADIASGVENWSLDMSYDPVIYMRYYNNNLIIVEEQSGTEAKVSIPGTTAVTDTTYTDDIFTNAPAWTCTVGDATYYFIKKENGILKIAVSGLSSTNFKYNGLYAANVG